MATKGYDPHQTLWHLFHQSGQFERPLTDGERKQIESIVSQVTDPNMAVGTLLGRFKKLMEDKNGKILDPLNEPMAAGLLECLNPYQAYSPWTVPGSVTFKMGGIYDHFKGGVYLKTGEGSWASGEGGLVVEYLSMLFGTKHYRLATHWCEVVQWPDGKYRSRFVYRGETLKTPEPAFKVPSPTTPEH